MHAMSDATQGSDPGTARTPLLWGVVLPLALILIILVGDILEGPKTAFVGVLAVVPMLAAVFAGPAGTALVGGITWGSALVFGLIAEDGHSPAQYVRLTIIAVVSLLAVLASRARVRNEEASARAFRDAALAQQLRVQAHTDELTGLRNRRGIREWAGAETDAVITVAVVDCDGLKAVNDEHGHLAGDAYLRVIAERLTGALASDDAVARWGGDEFLVMVRLPQDRAVPVLERLRETIATHPVSLGGTLVAASVSIGASEWRPGEPLDLALKRADAALYDAKESGRNRVSCHA
jgi:diguanylate cyclase (GGDEF)-like protein